MISPPPLPYYLLPSHFLRTSGNLPLPLTHLFPFLAVISWRFFDRGHFEEAERGSGSAAKREGVDSQGLSVAHAEGARAQPRSPIDLICIRELQVVVFPALHRYEMTNKRNFRLMHYFVSLFQTPEKGRRVNRERPPGPSIWCTGGKSAGKPSPFCTEWATPRWRESPAITTSSAWKRGSRLLRLLPWSSGY